VVCRKKNNRKKAPDIDASELSDIALFRGSVAKKNYTQMTKMLCI
jgi:hypothetical protein